ncbi:MAG: glutathione S-transferase C-terminal domain-containing protein [Verrucomicrobiota bacterium]
MNDSAQFPQEQNEDGSFNRQKDAFTQWVKADGSSAFTPDSNRYHLYVSYACPWAHRIIIARALLGLNKAIGMTVVDPIRNDHDGWAFRHGEGYSEDSINGFKLLKEAYLATDPYYNQRITVPVLWDKKTNQIVSNNDDDLLRMLPMEFKALAETPLNLYPKNLKDEIDSWNEEIYQKVNNGVYRSGFATTQEAYEQAVYPLFETLDKLDIKLVDRTYLFGSEMTETDIRLFVTLIRFDAVYVGHFKCNLKRMVDYPNLFLFTKNMANHPKIAPTINMDHIKRHYYYTHDDINPTKIVPAGPDLTDYFTD